jgi:hypothetical protein
VGGCRKYDELKELVLDLAREEPLKRSRLMKLGCSPHGVKCWSALYEVQNCYKAYGYGMIWLYNVIYSKFLVYGI